MPMRRVFLIVFILAAVASLCMQGAGCKKGSGSKEGAEVMPTDDVKRVMEAHTAELMAIPGVVGVAIGALPDGKPSIQVLVEKNTREIRNRIPREIEGYRVVIEETGKIKAF
jgi:hypothetical protein